MLYFPIASNPTQKFKWPYHHQRTESDGNFAAVSDMLSTLLTYSISWTEEIHQQFNWKNDIKKDA